MTDFYYYESENWESPYAVNYPPEARLWFVSHGFRLHYVNDEQIELLGKIKLQELPKVFRGLDYV